MVRADTVLQPMDQLIYLIKIKINGIDNSREQGFRTTFLLGLKAMLLVLLAIHLDVGGVL